jgi:hypothetical protein
VDRGLTSALVTTSRDVLTEVRLSSSRPKMLKKDRDVFHRPQHGSRRGSFHARHLCFGGLDIQHTAFGDHVHVCVEEPR